MELKTAILIILICVSVLPLMLFLTFVRLIRAEPLRITLGMWAFIILQYAALALFVVALFYAGKSAVSDGLAYLEKRQQEVDAHLLNSETGQHEINSNLLKWDHRQQEIDSNLLRAALLSQPKYQDPLRLTQYEGCVFAQNGEDGIIAEIFHRIGATNRYFVEFGSADGYENNTRCLLAKGWSGLWMDGDPKAIARAKTRFAPEIAANRLTADACFITAENIEQLFASHDVPKEFDFLSIDIDRNDYYVWKAIKAYSPRVVVIEYNGNYPPPIEWVVDYQSDAWWDGTDNYGASLSAEEALAKEKGYSLVGCCMEGMNAFFVRDDLVKGKFAAPFTAQNHYEPPRYWMIWGGWRGSHGSPGSAPESH